MFMLNAESNKIEGINMLLECKEIDVTIKNSQQRNVLMEAAIYGNSMAVETLYRKT